MAKTKKVREIETGTAVYRDGSTKEIAWEVVDPEQRQIRLYEQLILRKYARAAKAKDARSLHATAIDVLNQLRVLERFFITNLMFVQDDCLKALKVNRSSRRWFEENILNLHSRLSENEPFVAPPYPLTRTTRKERDRLDALDRRQVEREASCRQRFPELLTGYPPTPIFYSLVGNRLVRSRYLAGWESVPSLYTRWQLRAILR